MILVANLIGIRMIPVVSLTGRKNVDSSSAQDKSDTGRIPTALAEALGLRSLHFTHLQVFALDVRFKALGLRFGLRALVLRFRAVSFGLYPKP